MPGKTAILFGSTGLIGSYVLTELLKDSRYSRIILFLRKPLPQTAPRVTEVIMELSEHDDFEKYLFGNEVFICLGTTIRKAGTREAFRQVDFALPVKISLAARINEVSKVLVVSSIGANHKSGNFYLRTKGEMESALQSMGLSFLHIFRPSMLLGPRKESRTGETIGKFVMNTLGFMFIGPFKKYQAIHAHTVAKAMIRVANENHEKLIFESDEIAKLGQ